MIENNRQFKSRIKELIGLDKLTSSISGAPLLGIEYPIQLAAKRQAMQELLVDAVPTALLSDLEVVGSPATERYRVKAEFSIHQDKIGMRKLGNYHILEELSDFPLISRQVFVQVQQVFAEAKKLGIPMYNIESEQGFLRYLSVKTFGEYESMLLIVTTEEDHSELIEKLAEFSLKLGFKSVYWLLSPAGSDTLVYAPVQSWGESYLEMDLMDLRYLVGPFTFTQNNLPAFEKLLTYTLDQLQKPTRVLDLYAGIGTIGLQVAKKMPDISVLGVDEVPESIELAAKNSQLNGIPAQFLAQRTEEFLYNPDYIEYAYHKQSDLSSRYRTDNPHWDTIIVDPARPGLQGKVCRRLQKYFAAGQIIYISCNPVSLRDDLRRLSENYEIKSIKSFDLFPQTLHLETVVKLERIANSE